MAFKRGNDAALKHGAGAAEVAITTGADFTGLAREAEAAVRAELQDVGMVEMYTKRAARLQACADLYWGAILGAGSYADVDKFVQRWGWLQASALRALAVVRDLEKDKGRIDITDMLKGAGDGKAD